LQKNKDIKPPIIIEDYGLWNNEIIMLPTMIDDCDLQKNEGIVFPTIINDTICKNEGIAFLLSLTIVAFKKTWVSLCETKTK
jgi:hypothetical protein